MNKGLISFNGVPGSGKTLLATREALSHYKKENFLLRKLLAKIKHKLFTFPLFVKFINLKIFKSKIVKKIFIYLNKVSLFKMFFSFFNTLDYEYYSLFPDNKINNVYSTYPILLDKKRKIYSNKISLYNLNSNYSFYPNSLIIIDEIQLFADSDEYKDKLKNRELAKIAKFLQSHRHFGIKRIIFTSQHPSRIFKKGRNIITWYIKLKKVINIPFIPISIIRGIAYEEFDFYGRYIPKDREERKKLPFEYHKIIKFFNRNIVYNAYNSRYLSLYNYSKPLVNYGTWNSSLADESYLEGLFKVDTD